MAARVKRRNLACGTAVQRGRRMYRFSKEIGAIRRVKVYDGANHPLLARATATMNRILPVCFTVLVFAGGLAVAQTAPEEKPAAGQVAPAPSQDAPRQLQPARPADP